VNYLHNYLTKGCLKWYYYLFTEDGDKVNNKTNYALVIESKPNSYQPINIYKDLESIDNLTGKYSCEEFKELLMSNNLIDDLDNNITIIFNNNGLRKVKEGLIYKDTYSQDMAFYIINFINSFKGKANFINDLYQYVNRKKTIDAKTKEVLKNIVATRKSDVSDFNIELNEINYLPYYDIRTMYLFIRNVLIVKIDALNEDNQLKRIQKVSSES
jgi:hypothetical protein